MVSGSRIGPFYLEFYFLVFAFFFMLDIYHNVFGHTDPPP